MPPSPPEWTSLRSVLIHKPDHLGDALSAAPAVAALRRLAPQARFSAAMTAGPGAFWTALGLADEVIPLSGPDWWAGDERGRYVAECRSRRFDLIVNLRHDVRDILSLSLLGGRAVCTTTHRGVGLWHRYAAWPPSPTRHEIDNHLRTVAVMGVRESFTPGAFRRASATPAPSRRVVFHPFSRTPAKTWPAFRAEHFLRLMAEAGIDVTLIGGSEHRAESERWARDGCVFIDRVGAMEPAALFDLVAGTNLFIGVDSGPGHIAPLVGAPILTIASGTNEGRRFMPWGAEIVRHHVVCAPCRRETCPVDGHPCMTGVAAERVAEAALRLLGAA